jgi:hypothetical protein
MKTSKDFGSNQRGQVVIEYVLILFVAISCATILTSNLISRDPTGPGSVIRSWNKILEIIGYDLPDCPGQDNFSRTQCN